MAIQRYKAFYGMDTLKRISGTRKQIVAKLAKVKNYCEMIDTLQIYYENDYEYSNDLRESGEFSFTPEELKLIRNEI